jgi:hypothetical protein
MVSGESHHFLGQRYRLRIVYHDSPTGLVRATKSAIELHIRRDTAVEERTRVLLRWYREELKRLVAPLVEKWQVALGVQAASWGIKKMKTKWGTCNAGDRRIWMNLELAKKPRRCIEYVVVHELVHLLERHHNDHFIELMNRHLPEWRAQRQELNSGPLAEETWAC